MSSIETMVLHKKLYQKDPSKNGDRWQIGWQIKTCICHSLSNDRQTDTANCCRWQINS